MAEMILDTTAQEIRVGSGGFKIDPGSTDLLEVSNGIKLTDGTLGEPSIRFKDDTDTGFYSPLNGEISLVSDGTERLKIGTDVIIQNLTYPSSDGTNGQVLTTDGAGNLSFNNISVSDLSDIDLELLSDGDVLQYNSTTSEWISGSLSIPNGIDELDDVLLTNPTTDQILTFNGTQWVNSTPSGGVDYIRYNGSIITAPLGSGARTLAIGNSADAGQSSYSIAIGENSDVNYVGIAIGENATANNSSGQKCGIAIGKNSEIRLGSIAIGDNAFANASSVAIGDDAEAGGTDDLAVAVGSLSKAGKYGVTFGRASESRFKYGQGLGYRSEASFIDEQGVCFGCFTQATSYASLALGSVSSSTADWAISIGRESYANSVGCVAIGKNAEPPSNGLEIRCNDSVSLLMNNAGIVYSDGSFKMTNYTTAGRPSIGTPGRIIYDSTLGKCILDNGSAWVNIDGTTL